jgi:dihydrofolate reductase
MCKKELIVKMDVRCSVYIAASVDGFIAKSDGDIGWLHQPEYAGVEVAGVRYEEFLATVDVLVMGRRTFEKVLSFGDWPYQLPVIVLSGNPLEIPPRLDGKVRWMGGEPKQILSLLARSMCTWTVARRCKVSCAQG